jgi:2-methylcitrate dehydratase PrpD
MSLSFELKKEPLSGVERLSRYLCGIGPLPERVMRTARFCLLDTLGCGIQGSSTPEGARLVETLCELSGGDIMIWGTDRRTGLDSAALACGTLCHLRELDDVHFAILHTGSVCVPAAIAVAQKRNASLGQILRALVYGVEAMTRISLGMDYLAHRERGWHGTATCGAFGAAAAASVLLGADEKTMADALGIAGSRTGGSWAFAADNAMTKRLHPGLAARDGVLSACLAHRSISGPHYVLEAEDGGFYRLYSDKWDLNQLDRPSERYAVEDVEYKWFASCKSVHSPITAALRIHRENPGRSPEDVREILVEANASALSMAGRMYEPGSVISAQLSIPHGVALGICGRSGQSQDYDPNLLMDPALFELAGKVKLVESREMNDLRKKEHKSGARVTVEWTDGHSASATVTTPRGPLPTR